MRRITAVKSMRSSSRVKEAVCTEDFFCVSVEFINFIRDFSIAPESVWGGGTKSGGVVGTRICLTEDVKAKPRLVVTATGMRSEDQDSNEDVSTKGTSVAMHKLLQRFPRKKFNLSGFQGGDGGRQRIPVVGEPAEVVILMLVLTGKSLAIALESAPTTERL